MEQPETKEENKPQEENQPENQEMGDLEILPSDYIKYDYNYKVIVIGDSAVGKSSLTLRGTKNHFKDWDLNISLLSLNIKKKY